MDSIGNFLDICLLRLTGIDFYAIGDNNLVKISLPPIRPYSIMKSESDLA